MSYRVVRHSGPDAFLGRAGEWLRRAEPENNLFLAIVEALKSGAQGTEGPPYLATVEGEGGELVACVLRTPPHKPILTAMPVDAVPAVVEDLGRLYEELPAVLGPEPQVRIFAETWASLRGVASRPAMAMRLHELTEVTPTPDPPGSARWARDEDVDRIATWVRGFGEDAGISAPDPEGKARRLVDDGALAIWEDEGRPVSMAARSGRTPNGARIGWVYTPRELRGRGYATAVTAWLTRRLLASGLRWCFLYTDLANPTSNRIYRRIGYMPVLDVRDYEFEKAAEDDPGPADQRPAPAGS